MALAPLSLRAYAAHRRSLGLPGGSLQAVQRAIQSGRIQDAVVVVGGAKRIADPEAADREWAANTDLSRAPAHIQAMADGEGFDEEDPEASTMATAAAREKHFKALIAELTYQQRAGELVKAADVEAAWSDFCSLVRTRLLGIPSRMKQAHHDLTLAHLATLDGFIREGLESLATEDDEDDGRGEDS